MTHSLSRRLVLSGALAAGAVGVGLGPLRPARAETPRIRVGVLKFGTVNWELATMRARGLDEQAGCRVEAVELASNQATQIALQAGAVEMIVSDWIWVARQRAAGEDLSLVPYSTSVGALVVPANSPMRDVPDLAGKRIGVAGSKLDKGWLLLRAHASREHGLDLERAAQVVYGAPPLLNQQVEAGRLDAVLNYWHFAARLEAKGMRRLLDVEEVMRRLDIEAEVPAIGYVFRESWARANPGAVDPFVAASRATKQLLRTDPPWEAIRPLVQAEDEATLERLRARYREGIPERWGPEERAEAARLFALMAELGGRDLVGEATSLDPMTFWPGTAI